MSATIWRRRRRRKEAINLEGMIKLEWKRISKIEGTNAVKDSSVQQKLQSKGSFPPILHIEVEISAFWNCNRWLLCLSI
ncbi:hypothetical protein P8452_61668 [Trifolium repens]|nr:hypothetical protein P8452_61668 [Trifolium repens]